MEEYQRSISTNICGILVLTDRQNKNNFYFIESYYDLVGQHLIFVKLLVFLGFDWSNLPKVCFG